VVFLRVAMGSKVPDIAAINSLRVYSFMIAP
jgi:hypothetical protein